MLLGIETRNVEISPQTSQIHHVQSLADRNYPKESNPEVRGRQYRTRFDQGDKSPSQASEQVLDGSSRTVPAEDGSQATPAEQKVSRRLRSRATRSTGPEAGDGRQGLNKEVKADTWDVYGESDGDVDSLTASSRTWLPEISTSLFKGANEACHAGLSPLELLELELEDSGAGPTSIFNGNTSNEELVCSLVDYNVTEENGDTEETPKNVEQRLLSFLDRETPEPNAEDESMHSNAEPADLCDQYLRKQVPLNTLESFSQLLLSVMNESEHEKLVQTRLKSLSTKVKCTSKYSNANVTVNDLSPLFGLTREVLASKIGVGLTITKKLIRKVGISRWPCRKYRQWQRKLKRVIARHQKSLAAKEQNSTISERYKSSMEKLKRNYIYDLRGVLPD